MKLYLFSIILYICQYNLRFAIAELRSNDIRNHLGTRTPYRFRFNKNDGRIKYPKCKDTKIWMVVRHGTRLPSAADIFGLNTTLHDLKYIVLLQNKMGKGALNKEQIKRFEAWSSYVNPEEEKFLTLEGQEEMILLAERTQKRFPNAVKHKYDNETFMFRFTGTQRAHQSARYFTKGLFNTKDAQNVVFAPVNKIDHVLRFYKHCDKWQKQVKQNPETYKEQMLFGQSAEMNRTLESVTKRLGLNILLTLDEVTLMYKICGYETSWTKHVMSPWCYAFDADSIKMLEYYHDLKHYWLDGYGHNLTYRQACLALKTMFEMFKCDEKHCVYHVRYRHYKLGLLKALGFASCLSKREPFATFMFAHSGTLLKLLTHLHLFKPAKPLTADYIDPERPWKASKIDCFGSNLAFVLYKCQNGDHVLTLYQERPIKFTFCDSELCPLKKLEDHFHDTIHKCNYSDMCNLD